MISHCIDLSSLHLSVPVDRDELQKVTENPRKCVRPSRLSITPAVERKESYIFPNEEEDMKRNMKRKKVMHVNL